MKLALGADHAGFELKEALAAFLASQSHHVEDLGTHSLDSTDYPDFAAAVGRCVAEDRAEAGILVCGSGIGMAIAANKIPGVRAAVVESAESARLARAHNDANVLALGARRLSRDEAETIVTTFLSTPFEGGRHQRRVDKIRALEGP